MLLDRLRTERYHGSESWRAMVQGFRDLLVFQKAYRVSLDVHRISLGFPKTEQTELGGQIRRATKSIAINIAEGFGKHAGAAEFKRYLRIALGSSEEVRAQLDYCRDLGYITADQYVFYEREYMEIGKMLMRMIDVWQ